MSDPYTAFFKSHPDPMWVVDMATLRFLEVNAAAVAAYGYTEDEFRSMSINDLQSGEDISPLATLLATSPEGSTLTSRMQHRLKSGETIDVEVRGCLLEFDQRPAQLVCARNVSRQIRLEHEIGFMRDREKVLQGEDKSAAIHFQTLFECFPGNYLVLRAADLSVIAASNEFLASTRTRPDDILYKSIFTILPDNPADASTSSIQTLSKSIRRVILRRTADVMPAYRYPIPIEAAQDGFCDRRMTAVNAPIMGLDGQVAFIVHRVDDFSDLLQHRKGDGTAAPSLEISYPGLGQHGLDLFLHAYALQAANDRLLVLDRQLTNAERIGNLGIWEFDIGRNVLTWSENVYAIFGTTPEAFGHTFEHYLELVHPDDRAVLLAEHALALNGKKAFDVVHRLVRPNGDIRYVQEIAELISFQSGTLLSGVVRDVTEAKTAHKKAEEATFLIRAASRSARLGAWSVGVDDEYVNWSEETAAIHELAESKLLVQEALDFYAPEDRASIKASFTACLETGAPYDEVLQILTPTGRRVWVRTIGEAVRDSSDSIVGVRGTIQDISELIDAREETHRAHSRLHRNIDNISDGFVTLDPEMRFSFVNREAARILCRAETDLIGQAMWEEFPQGIGTVFDAQYTLAIKTRTPVSFVEYFPPLEKWLNIRAYPTDDGLAIYFQDITDQRAQQEQLQLLEVAVSRLDDVILICEADLIDEPGPRIVYVNDAFERITGFSRDEAIGNTPRMLQGPKTQRPELDRIRSALTLGEAVRAEVVNYTRDGREYWLEMEIIPIKDAGGAPTHFVAVERDVTARKNAESERAVAQERFRLIAQATSDVVWDWDVVAGTLWWNGGFRNLFGYDPEPFASDPRTRSAAIHEEDRDRVEAGIRACFIAGEESWSDDYRFRRADGSYADIRDHAFVIRDNSGCVLRMVGSMVDVTNQKKLEEELRQAQKLEAVGQLTGGIAHDFNNLLTVILGNLETLADGLGAADEKRHLAEMTRTAALRAADLTSRLLSFARRQALDPRPTDLSQLIAEMESLLRRTLGTHLDINVVQNPGVRRASIDRVQLENALLNLCLNARDAMPDGGHLTIEASNRDLDEGYVRDHPDATAGSYVMVAVTDTGSGMDDPTIKRAFEPFFTTKDVGKGSGLGLSMVYGFVKQSNGHLEIDSELGRGTTIRLYLPAAEAETELQVEPPTAPAIVGGSAKILLVEDDELVRNHIARQLEALGYAVVRAENAKSGLEILKQTGDFALLLTDVVMPGGMNGQELAQAARGLFPSLPVLFTSGYSENALMHQGRLDPGVHLLTKPYRKQDLAHKVREVLDA